MKTKRWMTIVLAVALHGLPGAVRAGSENGYRVTAPPAFPLFNTSAPSAWAASNGHSVVWTAAGSGRTTNGYPNSVDTTPSTRDYRLVESALGSTAEHIKPEYYLGDQLEAPTNVDWNATFARLTNSAAYSNQAVFFDASTPGIFLAQGGLVQVVWVLGNGTRETNSYQVSGSSRDKPYRIYWTDEPYNGPPVDLTGKFVKFYGDPGILTLVQGPVTNNAGGMISVSTNVVRGLFLDPASHWLKALGGIQGRVVMGYYSTGNFDDLLGTIVVEVCPPDLKTVPGEIGKQLLPTGDGYNVVGLGAAVTAGLDSEDDVGAYVYQHRGEHSYSPKNGNIYAIRKTIGAPWKIEVYWQQQDLMGTSWPFEVLNYECDWPADAETYVRGQEAGADGTPDYGLTIPISDTYTSVLMEYQEPDGHAILDGNNVFSTKSYGHCLLKLSGTDANGDDNLWFVPVESIGRDEPQFDLTPGDWPVGREVQPLPTAISLACDGTTAYLDTGITNALGGSFTVEGHFQFARPVSNNLPQTLFFKQAVSTNASHRMDFQVDVLSNGVLQAVFESNAGTEAVKLTGSAYSLQDGAWHHVALVYDAALSNAQLCVDGVVATSAAFVRTTNRTGLVLFGKNEKYAGGVSNYFFAGKMDDLRLWNRALGTNEILSGSAGFLHNATSATDLAAYYPINNEIGRAATDASGHGRDATMVDCIRSSTGAVGLRDLDGFSQYHAYVYEPVSGDNYNPLLYVRPDELTTTNDVDSGSGTNETYLFAVNETPTNGQPLEVWWSHEVAQEAMPEPLWFPAWVQQYRFRWPQEEYAVPKIVLASQLGSANLTLHKGGAALDFSHSSSSKMQAPDGDWFKGSNYTVECWIKPHVLNETYGRVFDFNNANASNRVSLTILANGALRYRVSAADGSGNDVTIAPATNHAVKAGRWSHVALVVSNRAPTVYLDGTAVYQPAVQVPTWTAATTNNHLAHGIAGGTNSSFDGQIDDFRIWGAALASNEVVAAMLEDMTGDEPDLRLSYAFDDDVQVTTEASYVYDQVRSLQAYATYASFVLPGAPKLDPGVLLADEAPFVYVQNDAGQPGYNPNEEHAFVVAGEGGYVTYALRCDLNAGANSSAPYVLVQYDDPARSNRPNMQLYEVVTTNEVYAEFAGPMTAGTLVPGPHPLDYLADPWNTNTYWKGTDGKNSTNAVGYRDRKLQIWAKRAGTNGAAATLEMHNFYPLQEGFFFPSLPLTNQPALQTPVPWLCRLLQPTADLLAGDPVAWTWTVNWPSNSPVLDVGQTLTTATLGLPEVWAAKSMMLLYAPRADSVALYDPIVAQTAGLEFEGSFAEHFGFETGDHGDIQLKNGLTYFKGVPPNVSDRFYYDPAAPATACLKLIGRRVAPAGGISYLQLNVLSAEEREALKNLAHDHTNDWREAVETLATNRVDTDLHSAAVPYDSRAVVNYALTHLGPGAGGYLTLIENDARNEDCGVNPGDPIQMHVVQLSSNLYAGSVLPLEDPNDLLSEQLDVLYTESFAGAGANFEFEWRRAEPNANGTTPDDYANEYLVYRREGGLTRFTIGKQGDTLPDMVNNFYVLRYRALTNTPAHAVTGDAWSAWIGPTLAEGWVQRVLNNITPFTQRMQDLYDNPAETTVSMIQQAGPPYEGDVALNQDNLNNVGLIQLYQTVLNKAESMSLTLGIDNAAANQQLMLAATRLNDLYMLLGNEAYADALDPTIGFGSDTYNGDGFTMGNVDFGALSSSLFCFDNLMPNLRDEELALLRGRSDQLAPSLHLSPTYNRLYWNFTKGITAGEVAYAMNYQIQGADATIDRPQAAVLYPQGHGDAWGHYLSALYGYYRLLRNPWFSWGTPSITPMMVDDALVDADYYDEAKFAEAAAALARTGAEIVKRTSEKAYVENGGAPLAGYADADANRAFGYGEWGARAGLAALYNWAAANSLLPPAAAASTNFTDDGIVRITRDSVGSLAEVCAALQDVQRSVDMADAGLTPIGLSGQAIPFDIDPAEQAAGKSHFEQIEERAEAALGNAATLLDRAQEASKLQRQQAQNAINVQQNLVNEEAALNVQLIGIFGYPYSDDIGAGGTYPQGYDGPDVYHYMWMDLEAYGFEDFELEAVTSRVVELKGLVVDDVEDETVELTFDLAANGMILKPESIEGTRRAQGRLQAAYGAFIQAYLDYRKAGTVFDEKIEYLEAEADWAIAKVAINTALEAVALGRKALALKEYIHRYRVLARQEILKNIRDMSEMAQDGALSAVPEMVIAGMAVGTDIGAPIEGALTAAFSAEEAPILSATTLAKLEYVLSEQKEKIADTIYEIAKDLAELTFADHEDVAAIERLAMESNESALALDAAHAALVNAQEAFKTVLAEGEQVLAKRERLRKQAVNRIATGRYQDMAFRTFRIDALAKYGNAFDLAKKYVYLATKAYDYETALGLDSAYGGDPVFREIVGARTLGFLKDGSAQLGGLHGDGGLADILARLKANWIVLEGRLGINNPETEQNWLSVRTELFRIPASGAEAAATWQNQLTACAVDNLLDDPEFRRYCLPFESSTGLKPQEPGLVIPFSSTIDFARNFFGMPLAGGDHAFDSSHYATKIRKLGVRFIGYNAVTGGVATLLADTPRIYLVPAGTDVMRSPGSAGDDLLAYDVVDQVVPLPFPLGSSALDEPDWMAIYDAFTGYGDPLASLRRYPSLRAYHDHGSFEDDAMISSTRLVGRSVWNTRWLLIIPAGAFHADRDFALKTLISGADVDGDGTLEQPGIQDIQIGFETYSHSGN